MIYDYLRVTDAHDTVLGYADLFSVTLHDDNVQEIDTRWDEVLQSMSKIPSDDILESLCKLRIRDSATLKTVLELFDMEIHQKISMPNCEKLKTMMKKSIDQNFDHEGGKGTCYQWKEKGQCSKGDDAVSGIRVTIVQKKNRPQCRHTFRAVDDTRSKCVEEKKYPRQK